MIRKKLYSISLMASLVLSLALTLTLNAAHAQSIDETVNRLLVDSELYPNLVYGGLRTGGGSG